MKKRLEKRIDSKFFVLANKPWTFTFVVVYTSGVFLLGWIVCRIFG